MLLERGGALRALGDAWDQAAGGRGCVALVTGEAGIGKSVLVEAFLDDLPGGRALVGRCDDLGVARPLGPIRDVAAQTGGELAAALRRSSRHDIPSSLLAELREGPPPTVLVVEDLHWADQATLDVLTVLCRRLAEVPAVVIITLRPGEAVDGGLQATLAGMPPRAVRHVPLSPLSLGAVTELARGRGDAARLLQVTGGNPFYVTELVHGAGDEVPASVALAVVGRVARLDGAGRALMELVSVVPGRLPVAVLQRLRPAWAAAAEAPERRALLHVGADHVRFRHELARQAVHSALPVAVRRALHTEILEVLLADGADPADIVHHAHAAGDVQVLAAHVLEAARRASAVDSYREAHSHYLRAMEVRERLSGDERLALLEEMARVSYLVGRLDGAHAAIDQAVALAEATGDAASVGRCRRFRSRLHWFSGEGVAARREAEAALALLEPLGETAALARAYSEMAQLAMLAEACEDAERWGARAVELAASVGDEPTRVHAMVTLGTVRLNEHPEESHWLEQAHLDADAIGDPHEATRALANLSWARLRWLSDVANGEDVATRALAYARSHEMDHFAPYMELILAWSRLRRGEWEQVQAELSRTLSRAADVVRLVAATLQVELALRRGDADAAAQLDVLTGRARRAAEPQRLVPVLLLWMERAVLTGAPLPEDIERDIRNLDGRLPARGWARAHLAAWGAFLGLDTPVDGPLPGPLAAMVARDWATAADRFRALGWGYDAALMDVLAGDREALERALATARGLGAAPLERAAMERLRATGGPVPRGPRAASRANAAGLTARQQDVLRLLVRGLTNPEIAEALVLSPRTVEHHVTAVLTKLGAASRREAAARAAALGVPVDAPGDVTPPGA